MGRLTSVKPRLSAPRARLSLPPKVVEDFYGSRGWRELVARLKRQRGNFCERCGSSNRVIGDHVVERRDGGADLDEANIELLCHRHHAEKTAEARRRRALGQT